MSLPPKLESFLEGFETSLGGCRRECVCGTTFYDAYGSWDWEEGEFEQLESDPATVATEHTVGTVWFEGKEYVTVCNCWHKRALEIMKWLDYHAGEIAKYLRAEKNRKQREATESPTVECAE